jgi:hypothetical protein
MYVAAWQESLDFQISALFCNFGIFGNLHFWRHRFTARATGNPTSTGCKIGPVMIEAVSNLGGQRCMAESGITMQFIINQTNSP